MGVKLYFLNCLLSAVYVYVLQLRPYGSIELHMLL